jgi:uncharacterized membrane protein
MSSAEAAVVETVLTSTTVRGRDATRAATVLALLALTQVTWIGALVYGTVWLLT